VVTFTIIPFPIFLAEAAKEAEVDYENEMNGLDSDDEDDDGSDGEMGMDDTEDGDEVRPTDPPVLCNSGKQLQ